MRGKGEGAVYQRCDRRVGCPDMVPEVQPNGDIKKVRPPHKCRGLWCAALELPSLSTDRRKKVLTAKSKTVVLQKLAAARAELERAGDMATASQPLEVWLTYWLDKVAAKRVRPSTLYTYRKQLEKHVIPALGKVRLDKLTPTHIRRLHDAMADAGKSGTYALTTHRVLSKALTDAVREGRVGRNVAQLVDAPRMGKNDGEALSVEEAISVYQYAVASLASDAYDPAPVLWTAYLLTGVRRSELLALEWDRVTDVIDLSWQLQRIQDISTASADFEYRQLRGKLYMVRPKSKAGWRVIPLVEPLATILAEHRRRSPSNPLGLVFARADGNPIEPARASAAWKSWYTDVELTKKHVPLHFLRHTHVDFMFAAGIDDDIKMEMVGHSTRAMTQAYKTKGNRPRLEAGARSIASWFEGQISTRPL